MSEIKKRTHRVCFTGHRPEKLRRAEQEVITALEKQIRQAIADGLNVFISGMARGVEAVRKTRLIMQTELEFRFC